MQRQTAGLVAIATAILGAIVISAGTARGSASNSDTPTPSPQMSSPSPTVSISPSPSPPSLGASPSVGTRPLLLQGRVESVSTSPVGFMNARLVLIGQASGQAALYVPPTAQITNQTGARITLNDVQTGDQIQAIGRATEGGILVSQLQVIQTASTPTPMAQPTPSPTPTPSS